MPVHQGLPKDAEIECKDKDLNHHSYQGESLYEFVANDHEMWERIHTGIYFRTKDVLYIYKGLTTELHVRCEHNKDRVCPLLPEELKDCLKGIRNKLHENPTIHIGWYAKFASLRFIITGNSMRLIPRP